MLINILVLLIAPILGGLVIFLVPEMNQSKLKSTLIFAGSFLFSITVIHILPELFTNDNGSVRIGIFVLLGFFLQQILEFFSSGAEHGHVHIHNREHQHQKLSALMVLGALCIHAFLEGTILAHPTDIHLRHDANALLTAIAIHKIPAALALMSILVCYLTNRITILIFLLIFSVSSPVGLIISNFFYESNYLSRDTLEVLFAIVCGNFLQISTTIVFETSPEHRFNAQRLAISILGAGVAVMTERFF